MDTGDGSEHHALTDEQLEATWALIESKVVPIALAEAHQWNVQPGSALAEDDRRADYAHISLVANTALVSAYDHLHAMLMLKQSRVFHQRAEFTLARGALENAGLAFWILRPGRRERITRGLRVHLDNVRDGSRAAREAGVPSGRPEAERIASLHAIATGAGINPKDLTHVHWTAVMRHAKEHRTSAIDPMLMWQLCSGFTHGRLWAALSFLKKETVETYNDGNMLMLRMTNSLERTTAAAITAMDTLEQAVARYRVLATAHLAAGEGR